MVNVFTNVRQRKSQRVKENHEEKSQKVKEESRKITKSQGRVNDLHFIVVRKKVLTKLFHAGKKFQKKFFSKKFCQDFFPHHNKMKIIDSSLTFCDFS